MKNKCGKNAVRVTAIMLCGILFAGSVAPVYAAEENTPKDENVYVNLNQDGSVDGIYVVNAYRLDADTQIVDYGNYESVKNLTSDAQISQQRGTVTVDAQAGEFFYQGNLQSKEIPWEISISYTLDGKEISAEELAGKNGKLRISIHVGQNDQVDSGFFENYLLQVTLTMDMERCSNLEAPGAPAANVGTDKQLVYSILAGSEKDITVTADVLDFEMDAISFQGLPMNLDVDKEVFSLDDLYDKAGEISDAADEFSDGAQDLEGGVNSLQEGVEGLQSGAESLKEGIDSYADGAKSLGDGIDTLQDGSNDLADGAQELVDGITSLQDGANQLRDGYSGENGAASGARKLADGVKQLKTGSHQLSEGVSTLVDMISGLGGSSEGSLEEEMQFLLDQVDKMNAVLQALQIEQISTGSETDDNRERLGVISDSIRNIIKNMVLNSISGSGSAGGNTIEDKEIPNENIEQNAQNLMKEDTAEEAEGWKGLDETDDQTDGIEEGSEEDTDSGSDTSDETGTDSGSSSSSEESSSEVTSSSEETGSADGDISSDEESDSEEGQNPGENGTDESTGAEETGEPKRESPSNTDGNPGISSESAETAAPAVQKLSAVRQAEMTGVKRTALFQNSDKGKVEIITLSSGQDTVEQSPADIQTLLEGLFELKAGADKLIGAYKAVDQLSATLGSEETVAQLQQLKEGAAALDSGIGDLESATDALADGISQLADGTSQLADGVSELADGGSEFADGTKELADGVSDLADGVDVLNDASEALQDGSAQLADGTGELLDGTGDLADGVSDLKDGTDEFEDQAGDIDTQIDEEVDGVISDLSGSDFEQISFVSDKNTNVELVQFVMQTEGIQVPEETDIPVEEEPMSFWQRLLALFGF